MSQTIKELQEEARKRGYRPRIEGPEHSSIEEILKHTWPVSDEDAEGFVKLIHSLRTESDKAASER